MYVQLLSPKHLDIEGIRKTYVAGDWVDVGNQVALKWLASGEARTAVGPKFELDPTAGVIFPNGPGKTYSWIKQMGLSYPIKTLSELSCFYSKTLWWDSSAELRADLIPVGFQFLEMWDVAIPLWSYDELAIHLGTLEERSETVDIVKDLRVPVYDTRVMFMRQSLIVEELLRTFREECFKVGDNAKLSFLRAIYRVKPLVLALPPSWTRRM